MKLNPYYEIATALRLDRGDGLFTDFRDRIESLWCARPELAPFLDLLKKRFPSGPICSSYLMGWGRELFSFAIPTPDAIATIAHRASSIVEIGAGTGYWSALLSGAGVSVEAFDNRSWGLKPLWHDVKRGGAICAGRVDSKALLLCWPPYRMPMAKRALQAFRGDLCVYVGEGYGGCTGSDGFHALLESEWVKEVVVHAVQYPGLHDVVRIYRRKAI